MITHKNVLERANTWSDIQAHLIRLYDLTINLPKEKVVVELGVRWGESTTALLAAVNDCGGHLFSVDILCPSGVAASYRGTEPNWTFILGDDMEVVKKWDKAINHLFIDTSHTYEHTIAELREWGRWVVVQGIISLHDIYDVNGSSDVMKAIEAYMIENAKKYEFTAFEGSYGLGLLQRMA